MPQKYNVAYIINEQQWYSVELHFGKVYCIGGNWVRKLVIKTKNKLTL